MLQHINFIGHGDGDRAAGATFADDHGDDWYVSAQAGLNRFGDGLSLAAFFRALAGICAGRVDQRDYRQLELRSHFQQALCLAVAFRARHAEIMFDARFCIMAFFLTHDDAG